MKKFAKVFHLSVTGVILLFMSQGLFAQSPYSLSPEWRFGNNAGLSFPSGDFPTSGAPSATPAASNPSFNSPEASSSLSDTSGAIAFYSDNTIVRNVTNSAIKTLSLDHACAGSSTGGAISIPDPASPNDSYYMFIANDKTNSAGPCLSNGVQYYKLKKNASGQVNFVSLLPINIVPGNWADESITSSTDGQGNYYIITHTYNSNTFRVFKVDKTGVNLVNGDQSKSPAFSIYDGTQSYSKISPCQNMIAWFGGGNLEIYDFDRTTGKIGNLKLSKNGLGYSVGLEFSPDGNYIYTSGQGNTLVTWYKISDGTPGTISGSSSWSMQMGPNGKIYTSPTSTSTLGVIDNPNNPGSTTYGSQSISPGSTYWGLINVAWLNPNAPKISDNVSSCSVDFTYKFQNYFNSNIPGAVSWDFGDNNTSTSATPSHTYAANGTYKVKFQINDATCGHIWKDSMDVTVSCGTTVTPPTCNLTAGIASIANPVQVDDINPTTVNFDGTSSTFNGTGTAQYYWMIGSPDTNTVYSKNATNSLDFAFNGIGTNLPQGSYNIYLVIRQGNCLDTATVHFDVVHPACNVNASIGAISTPQEVVNNDTTTVTLDGSASTFTFNTEPKQYYWMNGSPDTNTVFSRLATTSQEFAFGATGNVLPDGSYDFYLVIRQGNCLDTSTVHVDVNHVLKCTYNLSANINPNPATNAYVDGLAPVTKHFDGGASVFDASGSEPNQYYWMVGSADTTTALSKNSTYDMTFDHNGTGSVFPEGTYQVYLVIRQGLCLDTVNTIQFKSLYFPPGSCRYDIDAKIDQVNSVMVDEKNTATATFSGLPSIFDPSGTEPRQYYWMNGVADTNTAFAKTSTSSLTFAYKGAGGILPEGRYDIYLIIREGYCTDTAKVELDVTHFYIPNLITPNGDSRNETFEITNTPGRFNVEIFNRWGKIVYQEKGYTNGWTLDKVSDGVYYYHVEDAETSKNFKGWVQILRGNE